MAHVQIAQKTGIVKRVPRGEDPFVELTLEPHERIIELRFVRVHGDPKRKTVDWHWTAMVEHRFLRTIKRDALLMPLRDAFAYTDPNDLKVVDGNGAFAPIMEALEVPEDAITDETGLKLIGGLLAHGWKLGPHE